MRCVRTIQQVGGCPSTSRKRGMTLIELMVVLLILAIVSVMCTDFVSSFEMNQRADRAAREARSYYRYARSLALSTGKKAKVVVSTANGNVAVYWMSNGTSYDANPVSSGLVASGQMLLSMGSRELAGTTISLSSPATTYFEYNALGTCGQTGTVTFTCGGRSKKLVISSVSDPVLQ